jgi:solute carrier family 25 oxoglutarate transporter 11
MVAAAGALVTKMVIAAFAGMGAATICHPLDVVRVQMQTEGADYKGAIDCGSQVVAREGIRKGLYAGISAAYLRQWLYGSCRIGIYAFLLEQAQQKNIDAGLPKNQIAFGAKLLMGMTSGGIGSFIGTPSELALVRMSNDSKQAVNERRNYQGVVDCIKRIASEEGVTKLWTGAKVTVMRAMVLSACVLGCSSEIKEKLTKTGLFGTEGNLLFGGLPLLFIATLCSSFIANIFSNPFDVVKSRLQNQKVDPKTGELGYKSTLDCFMKIIAKDGVPKLWAGFGPAFFKLAPYTIISLILTEKITMAVTGKSFL